MCRKNHLGQRKTGRDLLENCRHPASREFDQAMKEEITIGILIFQDAEELDFVGPHEVFGMARELGQLCQTLVIAETLQPVRCAHGLRVLPDATIDDAPDLDVLVVAGGSGARLHARSNPKILQFVRQQPDIVASVCTGVAVLASAGVLDGLEATTHYAHFDMLRDHQEITLRESARFVMHDRVATAAGVTAGIDLSLALVARLFGGPVAEQIARNLEWDSQHWKK